MQHTEMSNFPQTIMLALGMPYTITLNIDVKDRHVNSALGTLQVIEVIDYGEDAIHTPQRLWLIFDVPTDQFARIKAKPFGDATKRRAVRIEEDPVPIELCSVTITLERKTGRLQAQPIPPHAGQCTDASKVLGGNILGCYV